MSQIVPRRRAIFIAAAMLFVCSATIAACQELHLFGGPNHDVYLGCLTASKYDANSVWNKYGTFGSMYSADCIWNQYGQYGSRYSSESPWNQYASDPPVVVDRSGQFYGYFTTNRYFGGRTTVSFLTWVLDHYEEIKSDFDAFVDQLR